MYPTSDASGSSAALAYISNAFVQLFENAPIVKYVSTLFAGGQTVHSGNRLKQIVLAHLPGEIEDRILRCIKPGQQLVHNDHYLGRIA